MEPTSHSILRPAWRSYLGRIIVSVTLLLLALLSYYNVGTVEAEAPEIDVFFQIVATVSAIIATGVIISVVIKRFSWKYIIDDKRITRHHGIISRKQQSVRIRDLRSVELEQSISHRILGIGHLSFYSAGSDRAEVMFYGINQPDKWKNKIYDIMDHLKDSNE